MFEIIDHLLYANAEKVKQVSSVNHGGTLASPKFILIHATGGPDLTSALKWSIEPANKTSSHILIDRNGEVVQLIPFNKIGWHAGSSQWQGIRGLNDHSIGIELVNAGFCQLSGGAWVSTFGKKYSVEELMIMERDGVEVAWQIYPPEQMNAAAMICACLQKAYSINQILPHEEVSPGRKWDPGPAFDLRQFIALIQVEKPISATHAPPPPKPENKQVVTSLSDGRAITYKVENLESGEVREYKVNTSFQPTSLLSVPYISQIGSTADAHNNDCGAASALMLLRAYHKIDMTVDEFYTTFKISKDVYLSVSQLRNALSSRGITTEYKANLTTQDIFAKLALGIPLIVLFRYKIFADAGLTFSKFQGPHFAVVVGLDIKNIYIHDPLYKEPNTGNAKAYPLDLFWKAWTEVGQDNNNPNPTRAAIYPTSGIGFQVLRKVKINNTNLNIRSGPSSKNSIVGVAKKGEVYEIQKELAGWGEIREGQWFNLLYTVPV